MIRQLLCLSLALSLLSSSLYASSASDGLKKAYEELSYSLEVEWDQKDLAFKDAQKMKFFQELKKLKDSGLTNNELISFSTAQIKDATIRKEVQKTFSLLDLNKISETEAADLITKNFDKSLSKGASWNGDLGDAIMPYVAAIIAVLVTIYVIKGFNQSDSPVVPKPTGPQPDGTYCGYQNTCEKELETDLFGDSYVDIVCKDRYFCVK